MDSGLARSSYHPTIDGRKGPAKSREERAEKFEDEAEKVWRVAGCTMC
jgi:hypothetical protein